MPFTLTVSQGDGVAETFSFEGGEVRLGRTADNDVVVKDPSSSRSHARVFEEDGRFFVEDMKSANGTKLNARAVKEATELQSGDRIDIGDVTLMFEAPDGNDTILGAPTATVDDEVAPAEDVNQTILKPPSRPSAAIARRPPARQAPEPEPDDTGDVEPEEEPVGNATRNFDVPPPRALAKRASAMLPVRAASKTPEPVALSAAERARERRELQKSTTGRATLLWNDLSKPAKIAVGTCGALVTLAMLGTLIFAVMPKRVVKKNEAVTLEANGDPVADSFGLGEVDFNRPDMKSFNFNYASPTAIVGVLHYQASDISKDEVSIELNGSQIGTVPPDTVDTAQRQLELVLPSTQLTPSETNEVVFDNVKNPPADDPWKIWNIWVEVIPIPRMGSEEAARRAKEDLERASKMYELRAVGAMNLFRSWKQYRDAWLLLEATPDRPADLLAIARSRMREIRPELDRKCSAMLVDYQKEMTQKYPDLMAARKVLQNIPAHFEKEHPCFGISRGLIRSLEDLANSEEG